MDTHNTIKKVLLLVLTSAVTFYFTESLSDAVPGNYELLEPLRFDQLDNSYADLEFVYQRNGVDYYFVNHMAINYDYHWRTRFNVAQTSPEDGEDNVIIRYGDYYHLSGNRNGAIFSTSAANKKSFRRVPVNGSAYLFNLHLMPEEDPWVCRFHDPPLTFHLQSGYPTEKPAEFYLARYKFNIPQSYAGRRENVTTTLRLIHESTVVYKSEAYSELLDLMTHYDHIKGEEIFLVAAYIAMDVGTDGYPFYKVPPVVQIMVRNPETRFRLYYLNLNANPFHHAMKYNWASNLHENILGYTFTPSQPLPTSWAITYGDVHQLFTPTGDGPLVEVVSSEKRYHFRFYLAPDFQTFEIHSYVSYSTLDPYQPLATSDEGHEYFFRARNMESGGARFIATVY